MTRITTFLAAVAFAAPAFAESHGGAPSGDAAAGEEAFNRQCVTCHVIEDGDGETIAGRGPANRTAPNLYGVAGRQAGSVEGFGRYRDSIVEAGEAGLMWNEEDFLVYAQDPQGFLREYLDDNRARSGMSYRVRSEEDAANIWAYLAQFGATEMEEGDGESESDS
jgi:cytochrome c